MAPKPKDIDIDYCIGAYFSNRSIEEIAVEISVSGETLRTRLVRANVRLRDPGQVRMLVGLKRRVINEIIGSQLIADYQAGKSILALSKAAGISRLAITKHLQRNDIPLRTMSEAQQLKMNQAPPELKKKWTEAAHAAIRGTHKSFEAKVKNAIAKQRFNLMSEYERTLFDALAARGIKPIPQLAIGPYNCDLACHPVAVEIWGGGWHFSGRHLTRTEERIRYLGDAGWHVLMLAINNRWPLTAETTDHLLAYLQRADSDPSAGRQYWVINGSGELLARGGCDDRHISVIPPFTNRRDPTTGRYQRIPR